MIDFIDFIFVKMLATLGLLLIFGLPAFVCWALIFGVTDPNEGFIRRGKGRYVSKHCNAHHKLVKGDQYNLQARYFRLSDNPEKRLMEFVNLYPAFSGG